MNGPTPIPTQPVTLTVLVENSSPHDDLVAEHGFAAWVETPAGPVLFDTGATPDTLAANARALGVDLARARGVVLSHGHYDHTGGLPAALHAAPDAVVYAHPAVLAKRWARRWGVKKSIGLPDDGADALHRARPAHVAEPHATPEGLLLSGPVPGPPSPTQRGFLAEADPAPAPDTFVDEVFLLARAPAGWVLVSGCCHRGLPNTLAWARTLSGGEPIRTILGGFHLKRVPRAGLREALRAIQNAGVQEIFAGHCTGTDAIDWLAAHAAANVVPLTTGFTAAW